MAGKEWARAHLFKPGGGVAAASMDLAGWLGALRLGAPQRIGALELWPLLHPGAALEADLLATDAIAAGLIDVRERDGGTVRELVFTSRAPRPVILFEGEVLLGAKQNRMVAHTVVIAPGATMVVAVGCVERGRWRWTSPGFSGSGCIAQPSLRRAAADQQRLWAEVDCAMEMEGVSSPTSDYHHLRRQRAAEEEAFARVVPLDGQVGVMALRDGLLVGLDVVGSAGTWRGVAGRIVKSLMPEARPAPPGPQTKGRAAREWLDALRAARVQRRRAQGAGEDVTLEAAGFIGSGVWLDGRPAHVSAFGRV